MSAEKFVLLTAGNPASGKDAYGAHLEEKYGATILGASDILKQYAAEEGQELSGRSSYAPVHKHLREHRGEFALPKRALQAPGDFVCLTGLRNVAYQTYLHGHGAETAAFWGSVATRYKHAANDSDPKRKSKSILEFWLDELPEYFSDQPHGMATVSVMNNAQHKISIEGKSLAQVHAEADASIIPSLIKRGHIQA